MTGNEHRYPDSMRVGGADVVISLQLRGLGSNYGMCVAVMGFSWQPSCKFHVYPVQSCRPLNCHVNPVTVTR